MKVALSIVFVPLWVIIKSANININLSVSSLLRFLHGFHSHSNKWGKKITYSKFNFSLLCWYGYFPSSTTTKSSWSRSGWKSSAKMSRLHWLWRLRKKPLQWFYQLWCNSLNLWLWWYISPLVVVSSSNTDEPSIHLLCYTLNSAGSHLGTNGPEAVNTLVCGWKLKYLAMSMTWPRPCLPWIQLWEATHRQSYNSRSWLLSAAEVTSYLLVTFAEIPNTMFICPSLNSIIVRR